MASASSATGQDVPGVEIVVDAVQGFFLRPAAGHVQVAGLGVLFGIQGHEGQTEVGACLQ